MGNSYGFMSSNYSNSYSISEESKSPDPDLDMQPSKQPKPIEKKCYGYRKDSVDERDLLKLSEIHPMVKNNFVKVVDMRDKCPSVYNQGQLGSCTANAICGNYAFIFMKENHLTREQEEFFSRLFVYWNERELEGTTGEDSGASLRDGIKVVANVGVPLEKYWPYDITKFAEKPSEEAFKMARKHVAVKYQRLHKTREQFKQCLVDGNPFVFGFTVYESFESKQTAKTGIMTMPTPLNGDKVVGGHAVLCVGYDDTKQVWIIRNSWGPKWGDNGYFYMPDEFMFGKSDDESVGEFTSDFWCIEATEDVVSKFKKEFTDLVIQYNKEADMIVKEAETTAENYHKRFNQ